jgi:hypothetical protein
MRMPIGILLSSTLAARSLGLAAGVVLAVVALLVWRVPTVPVGTGAAVTFKAVPSGELGVSQSGTFLRAPALIPSSSGRGASAELVVANQSPATLAVTLRALPETSNLDDALQVKVSAGDTRVYSGPLGGLRSWSDRVLVFAPGASQLFTVKAWIPLTVTSGWRGQKVDVSLQLKARPA